MTQDRTLQWLDLQGWSDHSESWFCHETVMQAHASYCTQLEQALRLSSWSLILGPLRSSKRDTQKSFDVSIDG